MWLITPFFKRITDDLKLKKLIPLKILFFVHASTLFVLYPYLTIHMRELGINVEETAIMSAVTPVVSIVMPPLAGLLADKIGNFRLLLALSSVLGGGSALLLLAVPVGRLTLTFPTSVELLARCDGASLALTQMHDYPCQPVHPYPYDANVSIVSCGFVCEIPQDFTHEDIQSVIHTQSYDIHLQSTLDEQKLFYRHSLASLSEAAKEMKREQSTSRVMTNDPFFNTTISKVSDREIFFPAPQLYQLECNMNSPNVSCSFGNDDFIVDDEDSAPFQYKFTIAQDDRRLSDFAKYLVSAASAANSSYNEDGSVKCYDNFDKTIDVFLHIGARKLSSCSAACAAETPRRDLCDNMKQQIELDPSLTFWSYMAVRVFIGIIGGTAFAMFEGAVIAIVREQDADYGLQRVYGSVGGMISSPLSGLLIDYASRGKGYTDFRPAFYLYAVLKVLSGVLMLSIDLEFKQPAQNLVQDVLTVFKNIEIVALFIACFIMGTAWGYIESFLFWLLQDLGASRSLMGVTITVGGIAGLPLLVLSGPIIRRLGHANVIFIGFVFYAIRLLGYSLIYNPWLCLIFEALESVTSSLSFTAAVTYAARLSSTTTDTSVQGLLGGLYYGVGKGSGSLIGGYLMKAFGTRPTYQIFAAATLFTGCLYFLFNLLFIKKRIESKIPSDDDVKKKQADIESRDNKDVEKPISPLDVATKLETEKIQAAKANGVDMKFGKNKTDGGSDSGVENPAFVESEFSSTETKSEEMAKESVINRM